MSRFWLLTSTFYGNWLPGDSRGFVARVRDARPEEPARDSRHMHDTPGTPYDRDFVGLNRHAQQQLKAEPVCLDAEQAKVLITQFLETATIRGWKLWAVAIMVNHVHLVVEVEGDPDPTKVLGDFKAYGSRALSQRWGKPASGTWWTSSGSKRKLPTGNAVQSAVEYVRKQPDALLVWVAEQSPQGEDSN
jgi:REP element-mobilizing transposase RayT